MDLLGVQSIPFIARRNYLYEFWQLVPWSLLVGVIEGQFAAVVVAHTFSGSEWAVTIASSTYVAAMMSSMLWGALCVGRPKVRLLSWFTGGTALLAGTLGLIPEHPSCAWWFVAQMAGAQILLAGVITTRSAVWKSNYPRSDRGRITARLQAVRLVVGTIVVLSAGALCQQDPSLYRFIFPAVALAGGGSIFLLSKLHMRGERSELRQLATPPTGEPGLTQRIRLRDALLSPRIVGQMVRVLRNDVRFRSYIIAQLLIGISNLSVVPIATVCVTQRLPVGDDWSFWISTAILAGLRRLWTLATLNRWAHLFDRLGVVRFRVVNCFCWIGAVLCGLAGDVILRNMTGREDVLLPVAVAAFAAWAAMQGAGMGGGALAWNLGHLHFAHPRDAEVYMGIHVSLTGIRGIGAPLLGMWLWSTIGLGAWGVSLGFALLSLLLFSRLARQEHREGMPTRPGDTPPGKPKP